MIDTSLLNEMEYFGKYALPANDEHCVGHIGFFILLTCKLAEEQVVVEPQTIHLMLSWDGRVAWTMFMATTPIPMAWTIFSNADAIQEWIGQHATFFIIGKPMDDLDLSSNEEARSLRSSVSAPRLSAAETTLANQLTTLGKALLAESQMSRQMVDQASWHQLTRIYAALSFLITSQAILNHSERMLDLHTNQQQQTFYYALQKELRAMEHQHEMAH